MPPRYTVWLEIVPTRFTVLLARTVAEKLRDLLALLGSVAVTLIVADPAATAVMVSVASDTLTVALLVFDEVAL